MKKKPENQLRDFLLESKFPRDVANDFKNLLIFCNGGKRLTKDKEKRFRDKKILTRGNKINIQDADSGVDWIMLGLYYQDIIPDLPSDYDIQQSRKNFPLVKRLGANGKQNRKVKPKTT